MSTAPKKAAKKTATKITKPATTKDATKALKSIPIKVVKSGAKADKKAAPKKRYDCSKCPGYCCSYSEIEVTDHDLKRLAKHLGLPPKTVEKQSTKRAPDGTRIFRHRKDHIYPSLCTFFDQDERRCTVYAGRPHVCRAYPNGNSCGYYGFLRFERYHSGDEEIVP